MLIDIGSIFKLFFFHGWFLLQLQSHSQESAQILSETETITETMAKAKNDNIAEKLNKDTEMFIIQYTLHHFFCHL